MENEAILCTGVSGSIGFEIADSFLSRYPKVNLYGTYRSKNEDVEKLLTYKNFNGLEIDLKISNRDELPPHIDVLINAAGISSGKELLTEVSNEEINAILAVNIIAPMELCKMYLKGMVSNGFGRIVNVNSIWGLRGSRNNSVYNTSKHAMTGLTKSIAKEFGGNGVTCNDVCPGAVESRMMRRIVKELSVKEGRSFDEIWNEINEMQNAGRMVTTKEVAAAVLFLSSHEASGINGVSLPVDGGMIA